jgi:hypothetical protein
LTALRHAIIASITHSCEGFLVYTPRFARIPKSQGSHEDAIHRLKRDELNSSFVAVPKSQSFYRNVIKGPYFEARLSLARLGMRPASAPFIAQLGERLPEECGDEGARRGRGREGWSVERVDPRDTCPHSRFFGHAGRAVPAVT